MIACFWNKNIKLLLLFSNKHWTAPRENFTDQTEQFAIKTHRQRKNMSVKSKQIHFKEWVTTELVANRIRTQIEATQYAERMHEMRLFRYFYFMFNLYNLRWHRRNGCRLQNYFRKWDYSPTYETKHRHYSDNSCDSKSKVLDHLSSITIQKQILYRFQFECVIYESWMSAVLRKRWINLFCCIRRDSANDM